MEKMTITDFIEKYCQDIIKDDDSISKLLDEDCYSYDVAKPDPETGKMVKYVVDDDGVEIPVLDIIEMEEKDFIGMYHSKASLEMYKTYLSNFKIDYGEDVLLALRKSVMQQNDRIKKFKQIRSDLDCGL